MASSREPFTACGSGTERPGVTDALTFSIPFFDAENIFESGPIGSLLVA